MRTKYFLGAVAVIGMTCAAGADLPAQLSPLAGVAFAKAHGQGHGRQHAKTGRRGHAQTRTAKSTVRRPPRAEAPPAPPQQAQAPVNEEERRAKLQQALEARAQQLAMARSAEITGSLAQVASAQNGESALPVGAQPRSVSFDFESGLKTTVYPGDRVVREGFDLAAAKSLAATPPSEPILPRPKP